MGSSLHNFIYPGQNGERRGDAAPIILKKPPLKLAHQLRWKPKQHATTMAHFISSQQFQPLVLGGGSSFKFLTCLVINFYRSLKWMPVLQNEHMINITDPKKMDNEVSRNEKNWGQCDNSTWLTVCAFLGAVSGCSSPRYCSQAPYMFLWIGKSGEKSSDISKDK